MSARRDTPPAAVRLALPLALSLALSLALLAATGSAATRRAFVTSWFGPGDLGAWVQAGDAEGLAAGDAICRSLAGGVGWPNAESFRVWLSDDTTDAWCHLQSLTGRRVDDCAGASVADPPQGPWVRYDDHPFSGRLAELADASAPKVYQAMVWDETGFAVDIWGAEVWTGTTAAGSAASANCSNWGAATVEVDGRVGNALEAGSSWTDARDTTCNSHKRILCFEPGAGEAPHAPPPADASPSESVTAFLSSAVGGGDLAAWTEAGGLAGVTGADAVCRALAAAAALPAADSFLAWLSDADLDAAAHLGALGPIRRVDGFPVAVSLAALLSAPSSSLESALLVTESCQYGSGGAGEGGGEVWTGTNRYGLAIESDDRCGEWTSAESLLFARVGRAAVSRSWYWTDSAPGSCATPRPIYCFSTAPFLFWDRFECGSTIRWSAEAP